MRRRTLRYGAVAVALVVLLALAVWYLGVHDGVAPERADSRVTASPELVARGAYLARAGNCMLCHTVRGGADYAGGKAIETPFGTVYSSNLTPDPQTGIGDWAPADFWRAMHHGKSRDGRLLYPAFPYTSLTQVSRADSDALYVYLRSLQPVVQNNRAHNLRWPYRTQAALAAWRALYFRPEAFTPDPAQNAAWNRGAYLVRGLAHCNACHTPRNFMGAENTTLSLGGGPIPMLNWYAPSLLRADEAGVAGWAASDIVALLGTGVSPRGSVAGPMAEVVLHSTQYLSQQDLVAMAGFLQSLPQAPIRAAPLPAAGKVAGSFGQGEKLYGQYCVQCHGEQGAEVPGAYPALAGNRALQMSNTDNLVQVVLHGGFAPATQGNPRPFGMPPYLFVLDDAAIAAVLTYVRSAWGNRGAEVSELEVTRSRESTSR